MAGGWVLLALDGEATAVIARKMSSCLASGSGLALSAPRAIRPAAVGRRSASRAAARGASTVVAASNTAHPRFALLFDCDGVIVETGA